MECVYTKECDKHHNEEVSWSERMDQARLIIMSQDLNMSDWAEAVTYLNADEWLKAGDDAEILGLLLIEAKNDMLDELIEAKAQELQNA